MQGITKFHQVFFGGGGVPNFWCGKWGDCPIHYGWDKQICNFDKSVVKNLALINSDRLLGVIKNYKKNFVATSMLLRFILSMEFDQWCGQVEGVMYFEIPAP